MKKMFSLFLIGLILAGCSGGLPNLTSLIATPTAPPPTDSPTPQPTVTLIPTLDLFSTATATPVTFTPTSTSLIPDLPTDTPQPLPTFNPALLNVAPGSNDTYFNQGKGFAGILYSSSIMYWNEGPCTPREIKFSVFVEDPLNTDRVYLFLRLREKKNTLNVGEWSAGAEMLKAENGTYNYDVRTRNLRRYFFYKEAWIEYQLVAVNDKMEVIGRTPIYDRNLSLVMCRPVGSP